MTSLPVRDLPHHNSILHALRAERRSRGLRQADLAMIIGIYPSHLSKYERGEHKPKMEIFLAWLDALGFRIERPS